MRALRALVSVGLAASALGLLAFSGSAAAHSVTPFGTGTFTSFTDPRGDLPSRPGSLVRVRYGPYTVPANDQLHNVIEFSVPTPCTSCRITDMVPDLVDSATGNPVNLQQGPMLHHFVLLNPERPDATCPESGQGALGERFLAAGNERSHVHLPSPYGYHNTSASWRLIYHLVNKSSSAKTVEIEIVFRHRPTSETTEAKPVWLDIDGCGSPTPPVGDSEYSIPTGYTDYHDADNTVPYSADWTVPYDARLIGIGGHLHDIDITWCIPPNNADDDGDGLVNDGCPAFGPAEAGANCANNVDNDGDGKVNDGCPASGSPETPCTPHCGGEGGGIAISADLRGGAPTTYYGPPPNNPPPSHINATLCRSQAYYGTSFGATAWEGHLDTMSQCGVFTDLPAGAQAEMYPVGGNYGSLGYGLRKGQVVRLHSEYQNDTSAAQHDVMGIMQAWIVPTPYPRPTGGSTLRVPLVPAFAECTQALKNSLHGGNLQSDDACSNPSLRTASVTLGTSGAAGTRIGFADVTVCNTATASGACAASVIGTAPDVRLRGNASDIVCKAGASATVCPGGAGSDYDPSTTAGPYTGNLGPPADSNSQNPTPICKPSPPNPSTCATGADMTGVAVIPGSTASGADRTIRITDSYSSIASAADPANCASSTSCSATVRDQAFDVPVVCQANGTAGLGSYCGVNTTANALVAGVVEAGKAAVVEIGQLQVFDAGPDGTRDNADDQLFAVQGIYVP